MKALIYSEFDRYGGTRTFFERVLQFHIKQGIPTAVVLEKRQLLWFAPGFFEALGVRVFTMPSRPKLFSKPWLSLFFDAVQLLPAVLKFRPSAIVVSNGTPGLMLGALLFRIPTLLFFHAIPTGHLKFGLRRWFRSFVSSTTQLATVSDAARLKIVDFLGVPAEKIQVVPNFFKTPSSQLSSGKTKNWVLTLGHFTGYKNPETWFEVASRVTSRNPEVQFVWAGDGDLKDKMKHKIEAAGLKERIKVLDFDSDISPFYQVTSVYFQPSRAESQGISILDAMACGIPCVGSRIGGIPESIVDGETGYLCGPDDVAGFETRILELIENTGLRSKMGQLSKERAYTVFSPEVWENKVQTLYKKLEYLK